MATNLFDGPTQCLIVRPVFLDNMLYNPSDVFRILGGASPAPPLGSTRGSGLSSRALEAAVHRCLGGAADGRGYRLGGHRHDIGDRAAAGPDPQGGGSRQGAGQARVVGGAAPTLQPDKFSESVDFVVVGEAENTISMLLADLAA